MAIGYVSKTQVQNKNRHCFWVSHPHPIFHDKAFHMKSVGRSQNVHKIAYKIVNNGMLLISNNASSEL